MSLEREYFRYLFSIQHGITDEGGAKDIGHSRADFLLIANQSESWAGLLFANLTEEIDHFTSNSLPPYHPLLPSLAHCLLTRACAFFTASPLMLLEAILLRGMMV